MVKRLSPFVWSSDTTIKLQAIQMECKVKAKELHEVGSEGASARGHAGKWLATCLQARVGTMCAFDSLISTV